MVLNTAAPTKMAWEVIKWIPQPEHLLPSPSSARSTNVYGATWWHTVGKPEITPEKGWKTSFFPALGSQHWSWQLIHFRSPSLLWETQKLKNTSNPHPVDGQGRQRCCWSAMEDACWLPRPIMHVSKAAPLSAEDSLGQQDSCRDQTQQEQCESSCCCSGEVPFCTA